MASDGLKKLTRTMPKDGADDLLQDMRHAESDRGCATLGCSIVEYALQWFITKHMIRLDPGKEADLFSNSGPLSDFGARINLAHAFGLIDANMQSDLNLLREIRNAFGHAPQRLTFENDAIKARCAKFNALRVSSQCPLEPRAQYISAVQTIFIALKFAGAGVELPLPFGCAGTIWAVGAPKERKQPPEPMISAEQLAKDVERLKAQEPKTGKTT